MYKTNISRDLYTFHSHFYPDFTGNKTLVMKNLPRPLGYSLYYGVGLVELVASTGSRFMIGVSFCRVANFVTCLSFVIGRPGFYRRK